MLRLEIRADSPAFHRPRPQTPREHSTFQCRREIVRGLANSSLAAFSATTDGKRARAFHEGVLELHFVAEDDFAIVYEVNGVSLRIQEVARIDPQPFTVLGWSVSSIDTAVGQLTARGVIFERYSSLKQDPRGIWRSPSGARIAWLKDPDENTISLIEPSVS